jgi:2-amino-4-hydroxy-6-hydroxymethyldihydropteridine diphosphokinase
MPVMQKDHHQLVYLSLGSNLGDRLSNLKAAADQLPPRVQIMGSSRIYETEPWGYLDQPKFLNQVLYAQTRLSPLELLAYLKDREKSIGRKPSFRFGPREVDIDILIYADQVIDQDDLIIPHPRLSERAFVLVPLAEIAPDLMLPGSEKTIQEYLTGVDISGIYPYQE